MSKRFTETQKWQDPWFRKLSAQAKLLWQYMLDQCDHIGLVELDFDLVSFDCKIKITEDHAIELGDRIQRISDSRYFIGKFIPFQYGKLSDACVPHRRIIDSVKHHALVLTNGLFLYPVSTLPLPYTKGRNTLEEKDKDKNKEKEENKDNTNRARATHEELTEFCKANGLFPRDVEYLWNRWTETGWKNGTKPIRDWKATIRTWKASGFLPSIKNPMTADVWLDAPQSETNEEEFDFLGRMAAKKQENLKREAEEEENGDNSPSDF